MSSSLQRRLSAIEAASPKWDEDFLVVRVVFVAPGEPQEIHSCTLLGHPGRFFREVDESSEEFMERVRKVALEQRRPDQSLAVALMSSAKEEVTSAQ